MAIKGIRLKSQRSITPSTTLNLPIDIPEQKIALRGYNAPKLKSVNIQQPEGTYYVGDVLHVELEFYSNVFVFGSPTITLNTGCHSISCSTIEVQAFSCSAARGMFALQLDDQQIMNIDVNTTKEEFQTKLRELNGIYDVSVSIISDSRNQYYRNQLCSIPENKVTISFNKVYFPQYDGDVPTIYLDAQNDYRDMISGISKGIDNKFLVGIQNGGPIYLPNVTSEVVKGRNHTDAIANYHSGNGTSVLTFLYTVTYGDSTERLDVQAINFDNGFISGKHRSNVSTEVPIPGIGPRYMSSDASSLSFHKPIQVKSILPEVVRVNSPNATEVYTAGDEIFIDVEFNIPIVVKNSSQFTLQLATGIIDRIISFHEVLSDQSTLRFLYIVQDQDVANQLDCLNEHSLSLNGGDIYRPTANGHIIADIILPTPGSQRSLSKNKILNINTQSPVVITASLLANPNVYTSGDLLDVKVAFSTDIYVEGNPRLIFNNRPRLLKSKIAFAPYNPKYAFKRSIPNGIAQLLLSLCVNFPLHKDDSIKLKLPRVFSNGDTSTIRIVSLNIASTWEIDDNSTFSGLWDPATHILTLRSHHLIPAFTDIGVLVEGSTGLLINSHGIVHPPIEQFQFNVNNLPFITGRLMNFDVVESVGVSNVSLSFTPLIFDEPMRTLYLNVSFPEYLQQNDSFSLHIFGVSTLQQKFNGTSTRYYSLSPDKTFKLVWNFADSVLKFEVVSFEPIESEFLSFNITNVEEWEIYMPDNGFNSENLFFESDSVQNGVVSMTPVYYTPRTCSASINFDRIDIEYTTLLPNAATDVTIKYSTGSYPLEPGDKLIFTLTYSTGLTIPNLHSAFVESIYKESVDVSVMSDKITIVCKKSIQSNTYIIIQLSAAIGWKVPLIGILNSDYFYFQRVGNNCKMLTPRRIHYSHEIIGLSSGMVNFTPTFSKFGSILHQMNIRLDLLVSKLKRNDLLYISFSEFERNTTILPRGNIVSCHSNINVSCLFSEASRVMTVAVESDFSPTTSSNITLSGKDIQYIPVNLSFNEAALLSLPNSGVNFETFKLSVSSDGILNLQNYILQTSCMGFCLRSIEYSTHFQSAPLVVTLQLSYSTDLNIGSTVRLKCNGLIYSNSNNIKVHFYTKQILLPLSFNFDAVNSLVEVTFLSKVEASEPFTLVLLGFFFPTNDISQTDKFVVEYSDLNYDGISKVEFLYPLSLVLPYFSSTNFTSSTTLESAFEVHLSLPPHIVLQRNNFVVVRLKELILVRRYNSLNEIIIPSPASTIDLELSYFDETNSELVLFINELIFGGSTISLTLKQFQISSFGINQDVSKLGYSIGLDFLKGYTVTSFQPFTSVAQLFLISDIAVGFKVRPGEFRRISNISIQFTTTNSLTSNNTVRLHIPYFSSEDGKNHHLQLISSTINCSVDWFDDINVLQIHNLTSNFSVNSGIDLTAAAVEVSLVVRSNGISNFDKINIIIVNENGNVVGNATTSMQCIGVCEASFVPEVRNPGRSSDYTMVVKFGTYGFVPGGAVFFSLPGFTCNNFNVVNITCIDNKQLPILFYLKWRQDISALTATYAPHQNNSDSISYFACVIDQSFNLIQPKSGIRPGELSSVNVFYNSVDRFSDSKSMMLGNIGSIVESTISVFPVTANFPVSIAVGMIFVDNMEIDDEIHIYLPGFTVPSQPLPVVATGNTVSVVGSGKSSSVETNLDKSNVTISSISSITVKLLRPLKQNEKLSFEIFASSGLISPQEGIGSKTLPWFAVSSVSSPIAGSTFSNITRIGSFSPASYDMVGHYFNASFSPKCTLVVKDSIVIYLPNIVSNIDSEIILVSTSIKTAVATKFNATWANNSNLLSITIVDGYLPSKNFSIQLKFQNFQLLPMIVYFNDQNIWYNVHSKLCPVFHAPFDYHNSQYLDSSILHYTPVSNNFLNSAVNVKLSMQIRQRLHVNDSLFISLPDLIGNINCRSGCSANIMDTSGFLSSNGHIADVNSTLFVAVKIRRTAEVGTLLAFSVVTTNGFYLYLMESNVSRSDPTIQAWRANTQLFYGNIEKFINIPLVMNLSFELTSFVAGTQTGIVLKFFTPSGMAPNCFFDWNLQGFDLMEGSSLSWNYISHDSKQQFYLAWGKESKVLRIVPLLAIASNTVVSINIEESSGFTNPVFGLPTSSTPPISMSIFQDFVCLYSIIAEKVSIVPFVTTSSLAFMSADLPFAFAHSGAVHSIQLEPGGEINEDDVGSQIVIEDNIYTISSFHRDILGLVEPYVGTPVLLGKPWLNISTPNFRYGTYLSGSATSELIFRYQISRGDSSNSLSFFVNNRSSLASSNFTIDLNGAKLLRNSQTPLILANLALPPLLQGENRAINSAYPHVVSIFSSSPNGVYSRQQFVDIKLLFSNDVILKVSENTSSPRLLLFFRNSRMAHATYHSGTGTNILTFLYEVEPHDSETNITKYLVQDQEIYFQSLRVITGNSLSFLRRKAAVPILDAKLDLKYSDFEFSNGIKLFGAAPYVTRISVMSIGSRNPTQYSAGEYILLMVEYSESVVYIANSISKDERAYIELNMGRAQPGKAFFRNQLSSTQVVFAYLVTLADQLTNGLNLVCTCNDYLQRTFIFMNQDKIYSKKFHDIAASAEIASNPYELLIDQSITINNNSPRVQKLESNASFEVVAPGDVILISVQYNTPVLIKGLIRLMLKGQSSTCFASYFSGNNTNKIKFIYFVSFTSGTARLECSSVSAVDTTFGTVYHAASLPTIVADNTLPVPGSLFSLSRTHQVVIDTSQAIITGVSANVDIYPENGKTILTPFTSVTMNFPNDNFLKFHEAFVQEICPQELWTKFLNSYNNISEHLVSNGKISAVQTLASAIDEINLNQVLWGERKSPLYRQYLVSLSEQYEVALSQYVSENFPKCFNWWNSVVSARSLYFTVKANRDVEARNLSLRLSHSTILNVAHQKLQGSKYFLDISIPATNIIYSFVFSYNGQLTSCLPVDTDSIGEGSIFKALEQIPELRAFRPFSVQRQTFLSSGQYQFQFIITFPALLEYELTTICNNEIQLMCTSNSYLPYISVGIENLSSEISAKDKAIMQTIVKLYTAPEEMQFQYDIRPTSSLTFKVNNNLPAGKHSISWSGLKLSRNILDRNSDLISPATVLLEHFSSQSFLPLGKAVISDSTKVLSVTSSHLFYSSHVPNSVSTIDLQICFSSQLNVNDLVTIHLPSFSLVNISNPSTANYSVYWDSLKDMLKIRVRKSLNCLELKHKLPNLYPQVFFQLPGVGFYPNDVRLSFSYKNNGNNDVANLTNQPFATTQAIGIKSSAIKFNDTRPNHPTNIGISFELLSDVKPLNSSIQIYLPHFFSYFIEKVDKFYVSSSARLNDLLDISCNFGQHLLFITPKAQLPAGYYNFTVEAIGEFPLNFPKQGMSLNNPPMIAVESPDWQMELTNVFQFPLVYGSMIFKVDFDYDVSYAVSKIQVIYQWFNSIAGPATLYLQIPSMSNNLGYMKIIAGLNESNHLGFSEATWYEFNKTLVVQSSMGWRNDSSQELFINIPNITNCAINQRGIAFDTRDGGMYSVIGPSGFLPWTPHVYKRSIPMMRNTSISLAALSKDIFTVSQESLLISFSVNVPLLLTDTFLISFSNNVEFNFNNTKVQNPCYLLLSFNQSSLLIGPSNRTSIDGKYCNYVHDSYKLDWLMTNISYVNASKGIQQYNMHYATITWNNNYMISRPWKVEQSPALGIYSSSVSLSNPYSLQVSSIEICVMTASTLNTGDMITIDLPGFYPYNISSPKLIVQDQYRRSWSGKYDSQSSQISLIVPKKLHYHTALRWNLSSYMEFIVPKQGIPVGGRPDIRIGLKRKFTIIQSQIITNITAVGAVEAFSMYLYRNSKHEVAFEMQLTTLSRLEANDEIEVSFSNIVFSSYPVLLTLDDFEKIRYQIVAIGNDTIRIRCFEQPLHANITISTGWNEHINFVDSVCGEACVVHLSIMSKSNPVSNYSSYSTSFILSSGSFKVNEYFNHSFDSFITSLNHMPFVSPYKIQKVGVVLDFQSNLIRGDQIELSMENVLTIASSTVVLNDHPHIWKVNKLSNDSLSLRCLQNVTAGISNFNIYLNGSVLRNSIIYAETMISYKLLRSSVTTDRGEIMNTNILGFLDSTINFTNFIPGHPIRAIRITMSFKTPCFPGDKVIIALPQFTKLNTSRTVSFSSNAALHILWDKNLHQLNATAMERRYSIWVDIHEDNLFVAPLLGSNSVYNTPLISFSNSIAEVEYGPGVFHRQEEYSPHVTADILFPSPVAGKTSDIEFVFRSEHLLLNKYDIVEILLPQFISFSRELHVNTSSGRFSVEWNQCNETLSLKSLENFNGTYLKLIIGKFMLPHNGVGAEIASAVNIESNSSVQGKIRFFEIHVQHFGLFSTSSMQFRPPIVGVFTSLNLNFALSLPLKQGDRVNLFLPGLNISSDCNYVSNVSSTSNFLFESGGPNVSFIAMKNITTYETVEILLPHCVKLPSVGIPALHYSLDDYYISANTSTGVVGNSAILNFLPVGYVDGNVHYVVHDLAKSVGIRINLEFSCLITVGDVINLHLPLLNSSSSVHTVNTLGDLVENNFHSGFAVTFFSHNQSLQLLCTNEVQERKFTVFVEPDPLLNVISHISAQSLQHQISATLSLAGILSQKPITFSPTELSSIRYSSFNIFECNSELLCSGSLEFMSLENLNTDEIISISHDSFLSALPSEFFMQSGVGKFSFEWRAADDFSAVSIIDDKISETPSSYAYVAADNLLMPVNLQFNASTEISNIIVASTIPYIKSVELKSAITKLCIGDEVYIEVLFSCKVYIIHEASVKLFLNTLEFANYYDGNQSNRLVFKYSIINPMSVDNFGLDGPAALELTGFQRILQLDGFLPVNLTLTSPFIFLNEKNNQLVPITISINSTATATRVYAYSGINIDYANGDILDIAVEYDRPILVTNYEMNPPELKLSIAHTNSYLRAQYVNVSYVQWLKITQNGYFRMEHAGSSSRCFQSGNVTSVKEVLETLPTLQSSLPVDVIVIVDPEAIVYKIVFYGVAPYLIAFSSEYCPSERASGIVSIDNSMLTHVVFRYKVRSSDPRGNVTYNNFNSIQLHNESQIVVVNPLLSVEANLMLPLTESSGGLIATSHIEINNNQPYVLKVSSDFTSNYLRSAKNGDVVTVSVQFSAPVIVFDKFYILLNVTNIADSEVRTRRADLIHSSGKFLTFEYTVAMGDFCGVLDVAHSSQLFRDSNQSAIYRNSLTPVISANLLLPSGGESNGLRRSNVKVNATRLPVILEVFSNETRLALTAGNVAFIHVQFSCPILVFPNETSVVPPFVELISSPFARMYYVEGNGTSTIVLSYVVNVDDSSGNVVFEYVLHNGTNVDTIGHKFSTIYGSHTVKNLILDTRVPTILKMDCNCSDGIYYPGQTLDLFLEFNKEVWILNGLPSVQMFVPTKYRIEDLLARYSYGNGSKILHFSYIIPEQNKNMLPQALIPLDYAGVDALIWFLDGAVLTDISASPTTHANVYLPTLDKSYLAYNRKIFVDLTVAHVITVFSKENGTFTVGDSVLIGVEFSSPVMFFKPSPLLMLNLRASNSALRKADYFSGNTTSTLFFEYKIQTGDSCKALDYVDTRIEFSTVDLFHSYPLISQDNLKLGDFWSPLASIFMASESLHPLPAQTAFPLPGAHGSLSQKSKVTIDTSQPYVQAVNIIAPNGTYTSSIIYLNISVLFNVPVVLYKTCPQILFIINKAKRFAKYEYGNESNWIYFTLAVDDGDYIASIDYYDQHSLQLVPCGDNTVELNEMSIRRNAAKPTIIANLNLPDQSAVQTVVSPKSIVSSKKFVNLHGRENVPVRIYICNSSPSESGLYGFGDTINIVVQFAKAVSVNSDVDLLLLDFERSLTVARAMFVQQLNETSIMFEMLVSPDTTIDWLSYLGVFAIQSVANSVNSSCMFLNSNMNCAAQNLPPIFSNLTTSFDGITSQNIQVADVQSRIVSIDSIQFVNITNYDNKIGYHLSEEMLVSCKFSDTVVVSGQPEFTLSLNYTTSISFAFRKQLSSTEILFVRTMSSPLLSGLLSCDIHCKLNIFLPGYTINIKGNFLSVIDANTILPVRPCYDGNCVLISTYVHNNAPAVNKVFSNGSDVFVLNDTVHIFVEFTMPVRVIGELFMLLDLPNNASAIYVENSDRYTLVFTYVVRQWDYSSALDYLHQDALYVVSKGSIGGIYSDCSEILISANKTLPSRGSINSLGRVSNIIIDQSRPNLLSIHSDLDPVTCGDNVIFSAQYSEPMHFISMDGGSLALDDRVYLNLTLTTLYSQKRFNRIAYVSEVVGTVIKFNYLVTFEDPIGTFSLSNYSPLVLNSTVLALVSETNGIKGPLIWPKDIIAGFQLGIQKIIPTVLRVFSPDSQSNYVYGIGDIITICVEMNAPIRIEPSDVDFLSIKLKLDSTAARYANYHSILGDETNTVLVFRYVIKRNDIAKSLQYDGPYAMVGTIYQRSKCSVPIYAINTLPINTSPNSLSSCCPIGIDAKLPSVGYLVPLKVPGDFGENEIILIIAHFTKPVIVVGSPYLMLKTGEKSVGRANYTEHPLEYASDLVVSINPSVDVTFKYVVDEIDDIDSLSHLDNAALRFDNETFMVKNNSFIRYNRFNYDNQSIVLQSGIYTVGNTGKYTAVDVSLRNPDDLTLEAGALTKQWVYRIPYKVEIFIRDLQHNQPEDLVAIVEHNGIKSTLFSECCKGQTFGGSSNKAYVSGTITTPYSFQNEDNGEDLWFSDQHSTNLAMLRNNFISMSSTSATAIGSLATDGNYNPLFSYGSVTQTFEEVDPWWQLNFPIDVSERGSNVGTLVQSIIIFERKPERWISPIVQIVLKGLERYPVGVSYRLLFKNINSTNPDLSVSTTYISMGCSAESLQEILDDSLSGIGNILVSKSVLPLCLPDGKGCGEGSEHGFGYTYELNFKSIFAPKPIVEVIDIKFPGEPLSTEIMKPSIENPVQYQSQQFPVIRKVIQSRIGYYTSINKQYEGSKNGSIDLTNENKWLTPFWVMLFPPEVTSIPSTLAESKKLACWLEKYTAIDTNLNIVLQHPIRISGLKIQREDYGALSLAEVEIYSSRINLLQSYRFGSPILTAELNNPLQPTIPFKALYTNEVYDGRWLIQIIQKNSSLVNIPAYETAAGSNAVPVVPSGSVSEAVVVITDYAGRTKAYYQDIKAIVTSLPRYGDLLLTAEGSSLNYQSLQEQFGVVAKSELTSLIDKQRWLGSCYNDLQKQCYLYPTSSLSSFHRSQLTKQIIGDIPVAVSLRSERIIYYVPNPQYSGQDFFTYKIFNGLSEEIYSSKLKQIDGQSELVQSNSEVNVFLNVQPCRQLLNYSRPNNYFTNVGGLCQCSSNIASIINPAYDAATSPCAMSILYVCQNEDFRLHFTALCSACFIDSTYAASAYVTHSTECRSMIIRAASLLRIRGMCTFATMFSKLSLTNHTELSTINPVCLQTTDVISASSKMRANYITTRAAANKILEL